MILRIHATNHRILIIIIHFQNPKEAFLVTLG